MIRSVCGCRSFGAAQPGPRAAVTAGAGVRQYRQSVLPRPEVQASAGRMPSLLLSQRIADLVTFLLDNSRLQDHPLAMSRSRLHTNCPFIANGIVIMK